MSFRYGCVNLQKKRQCLFRIQHDDTGWISFKTYPRTAMAGFIAAGRAQQTN